ncbi:hypothetical protein [Pseudomonas congelans]|uniref:hypothetical protein n=1 Tax=Pseudomonas congelans TaxID=200452 RepID=UPI001179C420|nr:hypothetical protein [Pseudomonas congelans]
MRSLSYKRIFDRTILEGVLAHYTSLAGIGAQIKNSYRQYVLTKGSPSITPIGMSAPQRADFENAYSNKPVSAGLSWISELYINGLNSCPFCGGDGARTLEHYLPQASYPEFSVYSLNLLPSCGSCNSKRNSLNAHGATTRPLHPYFDKQILRKLDAYTVVNFDCGIIGFHLTYDRIPFNDEEQLRIDYHIEISLDETSYINRTLDSLETLKISAEKYASAADFRSQVIDDQIYISERKKDFNSWHHALCKGLAALSNDELQEIFEGSFNLRPLK